MPVRKLDLSIILADRKIKVIQEKNPLLITGYGNIEVKKNYKDYLLRINFEDDVTSDRVQPETAKVFPLMSRIYKGKIVDKVGEIKEIEIEPRELKYNKIKYLDSEDKIRIHEKLDFGQYSYFGISDNLIIPSLIIGTFFYFPNTPIRRLFFHQDVTKLVYTESCDCKKGRIELKNNVKYDEHTVTLLYLFLCNRYFTTLFKNIYENNVHNNNYLEIPKYLISLFKFPFPERFKALVRGEEVDGKFIVYEIIDIDFSSFVFVPEINASYKGRNILRLGTNNRWIEKKVPKNLKNVSHFESYSKKFLETYYQLFEIDSHTLINKLKVKKTDPISSIDIFTVVNNYYKRTDNQGISLSQDENGLSMFGKGSVAVTQNDFSWVVETLKKELEIEDIEVVTNDKDYSYFHFYLQELDREYMIIKLKRPQTAWYVLSTANPPLQAKHLAYHLVQIADKSSDRYKNNNDFGRKILRNYGVCFHQSQKVHAKSERDWIDRLIRKLFVFNNCKGTSYK